MKPRLLFCALAFLAASAFAGDDDRIDARDLPGTVAVKGIDSAGAFVGDDVASAFSTYGARGKVMITASRGDLRKVETYLDWTAPGDAHGHVWEKLWVSGDAYTGWSERQIQASNANVFSRTVISGSIKQRIGTGGDAVIEWTVSDADSSSQGGTSDSSSDDGDTSDSSEDDSAAPTPTVTPTPTPRPLPAVDIDQEGTYQGSFFRQIKIKGRGSRHSTITFSDEGFERSTLGDGEQLLTVQERVKVGGTGRGSLAFSPTPAPGPTITPTPTVTPEPTVSPTPDDTGGL